MERIVFDKMKSDRLVHYTMNLHLQLYAFAHRHIYNKSIIDAACGTGFGTMIFSTAAKKILAVDIDQDALDYGKERLSFFCPVTFLKKDLNKEILPKADVCVSLETIEHLDSKGFFLENLQAKTLVYSVPLDSPIEDTFHTMYFPTSDDAVNYLRSFGWYSSQIMVGENGMMMGIAKKVKNNMKE